MHVDAQFVRELTARRESRLLDFKTAQYDWNNEGNLELAKDIMAMANSLAIGDPPGIILIGVDEDLQTHTGVLIGIPAADHLDDASFQQKVATVGLNRVPAFGYHIVQVDGMSVGVLGVLPGGRPYFSLRTRGRHLVRHVALHRVGTSTDHASPAEIIEWARTDDPISAQLRAAELERSLAEVTPRPAFEVQAASRGKDYYNWEILVGNHGSCTLVVRRVELHLHLGAHAPFVQTVAPNFAVGPARARVKAEVGVKLAELLERFGHDIPMAADGRVDWPAFQATVAVVACGPTGREATVERPVTIHR